MMREMETPTTYHFDAVVGTAAANRENTTNSLPTAMFGVTHHRESDVTPNGYYTLAGWRRERKKSSR